MPVKFKDYYEILGAKRGASQDEIKSAYRRLARKHHPDLNRGDEGSESRFKDVSEAYEVLKDPEMRRRYDQLGPNFRNGQDFQPPPGWENVRFSFDDRPFGGFNFQGGEVGGGRGGGFSEFFESLFGDFGPLSGSKGVGGAFSERIRTGRGRNAGLRGQSLESEFLISLEEAHKGALKEVSLQVSETCANCGGSGGVGGLICPDCRGRGERDRSRNYKVNVPPGVSEGNKIRLAGQGGKGVGDGSAGDLYLRIRLQKHPLFRLSGRDLEFDLRLAPWEAVLGTRIRVPTLDGPVDLTIKPGTSSGARLRLKGKGLANRDGGAGDLYAVVKIVVPSKLSKNEKQIYQRLSRESEFDPRP
ncbi:DnaJ C-terminal domain-containing protein [candidate division KSB1 bacterium]